MKLEPIIATDMRLAPTQLEALNVTVLQDGSVMASSVQVFPPVGPNNGYDT